MASIFTYQDEPHRVHSPWSTPGSSTPQITVNARSYTPEAALRDATYCDVTRLEPEKHDGPIEYKLHLLLRWRRTFTSSTTAVASWTNQQGRLESVSAASPSLLDSASTRTATQPSTQNRQARLQQLTTQLLWRLQQSSPFHSSSNAKLVLPVLPEATPRLGVPERPSKLLPGLEESQGALYEIGVADDGTLVGLADEEMDESLCNLRAMAASLGCVVDVHRRVIVGDCEWIEDGADGSPVTRTSKLWVAEVLVRPDNKSVEIVPTESEESLRTLRSLSDSEPTQATEVHNHHQQLRIALVGVGSAGKSSLLGTLTTSALDNGRGKSRLSLLKHRHEIASGITSSVAQELLGYQLGPTTAEPIVNYATGDVSSWPDIHNLSDKLIFLSDSPGLPRYAKSTFRALISWSPAWTMICIPANDQMHTDATINSMQTQPGYADVGVQESSLSLAHLELCLKLGRPFLIAITKMDLANKTGLRQLLSPILSIIKAAAKTPVLVNLPAMQNVRKDDVDFVAAVNASVMEEQSQVESKLHNLEAGVYENMVPIVMTSAVTGFGIATLHALLRLLPASTSAAHMAGHKLHTRAIFRTDEVFAIPPSKVYSNSVERAATDTGVVLCGVLDTDTISLGDHMILGPFLSESDSNESSAARGLRRASSHHGKSASQSLPRSLSENFSKSLQLNGKSLTSTLNVIFVNVKVVSLRNLRLPVTSLQAGDTGTVGIQITDDSLEGNQTAILQKARKGMVLTTPSSNLHGYSSFVASFPYADFGAAGSPPLILGGHAIAYIHSVRAAVRVTAVALEDDNSNGQRQTSSHQEVFSFEDEDDANDGENGMHVSNSMRTDRLTISFQFVSTVEFIEVDDQVLVIPNITPAGPVSGPQPTTTILGFSGFVGRIRSVCI